MEKKSGINDVILFNFVANNICDYFLYGNTASNKKENISEINFNNIKNSVIENEEKQIDDFDDNN